MYALRARAQGRTGAPTCRPATGGGERILWIQPADFPGWRAAARAVGGIVIRRGHGEKRNTS
jgi:hypothetical protein